MTTSEITRIQDQLHRALQADAWHGPCLSALLADVTAPKAAAKPIPAAHSIWELVLHIAAWQKIGVRRLAGEMVVDVPEEENFPPVTDKGEVAWKKAKEGLALAHEQLMDAIGRLTDARLEEIVPGKGHSVYVLLHGIIQHNLYHAGQIAILKKM